MGLERVQVVKVKEPRQSVIQMVGRAGREGHTPVIGFGTGPNFDRITVDGVVIGPHLTGPPPIVRSNEIVQDLVNAGATTVRQLTAAYPIGGHRVVSVDTSGNAVYADATDVSTVSRILGVTQSSSAAAAPVFAYSICNITEPSWNWDVNKPVFLREEGLLTQSDPSSLGLKFSIVVGIPTSPTSIIISIGQPVVLAV